MPGKVSKKARLKHIKADTKTGCKIAAISGSLLFSPSLDFDEEEYSLPNISQKDLISSVSN